MKREKNHIIISAMWLATSTFRNRVISHRETLFMCFLCAAIIQASQADGAGSHSPRMPDHHQSYGAFNFQCWHPSVSEGWWRKTEWKCCCLWIGRGCCVARVRGCCAPSSTEVNSFHLHFLLSPEHFQLFTNTTTLADSIVEKGKFPR